MLLGGENHTFENSNCGVSSVRILYRIYLSSSPSGSFSSINLPFAPAQTLPNPAGDKFWQISSSNNGPMTVNLLNGLSSGSYTIEFYYEAIAGCNGNTNFTIYDNNGGANFTNTFSVIDIPPTPTINTTPATCSASGSSSISNYNSAYSYTFNPSGPGAGPAISGVIPGTNYSVSASNGSCGPSSSASFTNPIQLATPTAPTSVNSSAAEVCINTSVTLSGNCSSGIIKWYSDAGLITSISSPVTPTSGSISTGFDNIYYATCEDNGCKSPSSSTVVKSFDCTLPIKLLSFKGDQIENGVQVNWTVTEMVNFSRFELEKSSNAISFEKIHTVWTQKNISVQQSFGFRDTYTTKGNNYYRLKMVDQDGSSVYSKIIGVNFKEGAEYAFVENPVNDKTISLKTNIGNPIIKVMSITGIELPISILSKNGAYHIVLKESTVPGIYILNVLGDSKKMSIRVFVN